MVFTVVWAAEKNPFAKLAECDVQVLSEVSEHLNGETEVN